MAVQSTVAMKDQEVDVAIGEFMHSSGVVHAPVFCAEKCGGIDSDVGVAEVIS